MRSGKTLRFADTSKKIFGPGCLPIDELIVKTLCSELDLGSEEEQGHKFADYARELEERFRSMKSLKEK